MRPTNKKKNDFKLDFLSTVPTFESTSNLAHFGLVLITFVNDIAHSRTHLHTCLAPSYPTHTIGSLPPKSPLSHTILLSLKPPFSTHSMKLVLSVLDSLSFVTHLCIVSAVFQSSRRQGLPTWLKNRPTGKVTYMLLVIYFLLKQTTLTS
jgi:hypothetical protein